MGEKIGRDWTWTPVIIIAGMHVMMTEIDVIEQEVNEIKREVSE